MTASRTRHGGIIAAGRGSRLSAQGSSKALVQVCGMPLIDHVLDQFRTAGVTDVTVAARSDDVALARYLEGISGQRGCARVHLLPVDSAVGAGGAMKEIIRTIGAQAMLLSTVDFIGPAGAAAALALAGEQAGGEVIGVLAVAKLLHDDRPMWVDVEGRQIRDYGKDLGDTGLVFGNVRWLSERALAVMSQLPGWANGSGDSQLIRELVRSRPGSLHARLVDPVVDVDDEVDLALAEGFLLGKGSNTRDLRRLEPVRGLSSR